jgi:hypothetical protein
MEHWMNWFQFLKFKSNILISIQIQTKRNKIKIGIGGIEDLLMNMVLKKKL